MPHASLAEPCRRGSGCTGVASAATLRLVRALSTQAGEQARAALPALEDEGATSVLVAGAGGIGSRLVERQLREVFQPAGISPRMVQYGTSGREPARWYVNAEDRRAV